MKKTKKAITYILISSFIGISLAFVANASLPQYWKTVNDLVSRTTAGIDINGNDFIIDTDGDSYFHELSDDVIEFVTGTDTGSFVFTTGNVGIGTTAPSSRLNVENGDFKVYNNADLAGETLQDGDFSSFTKWTDAGDFNEGTNDYDYLHSGGTGQLTQTAANLSIVGANNRRYKFVYTISNVTAVGTLTATITTSFAANAETLDISDGTKTLYFQSAATTVNFVIDVVSDTASDGFTIDDVSLKEIDGGDLIMGGLITGGGTKGLKILGTGYVGIDTEVPINDLQIGDIGSAGTNTPNTFSMGGTYSLTAGQNPKFKLYDTGSNEFGFGVSANQMDFMVNSGASYAWWINQVEKMTMDSNGNVGIGDTSPDYPLEILSTTTPQFSITNTDATDYATFGVDTDGELTITTVDGGGAGGHINLMPDGNVGIGTTAPSETLDVNGNIEINSYIRTPAGTGILLDPGNNNVALYDSANAFRLDIYDGQTINVVIRASGVSYFNGGNVGIGDTSPDANLEVVDDFMVSATATGDGNLFIVKNSGNVGLGSITEPSANGGKVLFFGDNTADPTMASNTAGLYGKDIGGTVEMFATDEAGNATQLTPHNFSLFTPDLSYTYPWSYYSKNPYIGKEINVDIYGAMKEIERLSGKTFIYEEDMPTEEIINWDKQQQINKEKIEEQRLEKAIEKIMEHEIEVIKSLAIDLIIITEEVEVDTTIEITYELNSLTGNIDEVKTEVSVYEDQPTGEYEWKIKEGIRLDRDNGKFYRNKTREEAEAEVVIDPYLIKKLPKWIEDRVPIDVLMPK